MIRTPSIQWLSVGIVACFVIGAVVLLLGTGTVTAQNSDQTISLNKTGSPDTIRVGQTKQNITNINIKLKQTNTSQNIRLFVELTSVKSKGVNISSTSISIKNIQNGSVINTSNLDLQNNTILTATIHPNESSDSIQISSAQISNINSTNANKSTNLTYEIGVINGSTSISKGVKDDSATNTFNIMYVFTPRSRQPAQREPVR